MLSRDGNSGEQTKEKRKSEEAGLNEGIPKARHFRDDTRPAGSSSLCQQGAGKASLLGTEADAKRGHERLKTENPAHFAITPLVESASPVLSVHAKLDCSCFIQSTGAGRPSSTKKPQ
jgi:hypothetical protein